MWGLRMLVSYISVPWGAVDSNASGTGAAASQQCNTLATRSNLCPPTGWLRAIARRSVTREVVELRSMRCLLWGSRGAVINSTTACVHSHACGAEEWSLLASTALMMVMSLHPSLPCYRSCHGLLRRPTRKSARTCIAGQYIRTNLRRR